MTMHGRRKITLEVSWRESIGGPGFEKEIRSGETILGYVGPSACIYCIIPTPVHTPSKYRRPLDCRRTEIFFPEISWETQGDELKGASILEGGNQHYGPLF
jgi:hypothetical protein